MKSVASQRRAGSVRGARAELGVLDQRADPASTPPRASSNGLPSHAR
jgi:hypothetical protein